MSLYRTGLRYERLLMLAAPISLACILFAFVASASNVSSVQKDAACKTMAAGIIDKNITELEKIYSARKRIGNQVFDTDYVYKISTLFSQIRFDQDCYEYIKNPEYGSNIPPAKYSEQLKQQAKEILEKLEKTPIQSYGVEIPKSASLSVLGTPIKMSITTAIQVLQVVLIPILILWLGSLYNTRYRETLLIDSSGQISDLYPHAVNIYLVGTLPPLRKKSYAKYYLKQALPYLPTAARLFVLSIFLLPSIVAYNFSLYYLSQGLEAGKVAVGFFVSIYVYMNLALELMPWHSGKRFPPARSLSKPG